MTRAWRSVFFGLTCLLGACRAAEEAPAQVRESPGTPPSAEAPAAGKEQERHLLKELAACEFSSSGLLIDAETQSAALRRSRGFGGFEPAETVERAGATFLRMVESRVSYDVWLDGSVDALRVSARIHGGPARWVTAYLDDKRLGSVRLESGKTTLAKFLKVRGEVAAGRHAVLLRFWGGERKAGAPYADLDWVSIASGPEDGDDDAPPTERDVRTDVVLDAQPRQALALRPGARVTCPTLVTEPSSLAVDLGLWGSGAGVAEIRVLETGREPVLLHTHKLSGGEGATWSTARLDLGRWNSRLVGLEFQAVKATRGARVAFGEPRLVRTPKAAAASRARLAVVVVLAGVSRRVLPPWSSAPGLPVMAEFARSAARFDRYRAPSTLPAAVLASLFTGLLPERHEMLSQASRVSSRVPLVGELLAKGAGRAAFFTGAPTSFKAFGFGRGWDAHAEISPVLDIAATEPFSLAKSWLEQELKGEPRVPRVLIVHARGAHPPWDLALQELDGLKPDDYSGVVDARRGGIAFARLRSLSARLDERDWVRLGELERAALKKQDAALGQLISVLKDANAWEDALFVVMGDVAPGNPPEVPFHPAGELTEDRLRVPLFVKFPGGLMASEDVPSEVTTIDITQTILSSLGVEAELEGKSLLDLGTAPLGGRPLVAVLGDRYSTAFGPWLLTGRTGALPRLCRADVDPACVTNLFDKAGLAARAGLYFSRTTLENLAKPPNQARESVEIDPPTAAALTVWGDLR